MITTEHRKYAIAMLKEAIELLKKDKSIHDGSAIDYIRSGLGELTDNE